jgi:hypothetical protein
MAPGGEDVTGIVCLFFRVSVTQLGNSRLLVRVREKNRAVFLLGIFPPLGAHYTLR